MPPLEASLIPPTFTWKPESPPGINNPTQTQDPGPSPQTTIKLTPSERGVYYKQGLGWLRLVTPSHHPLQKNLHQMCTALIRSAKFCVIPSTSNSMYSHNSAATSTTVTPFVHSLAAGLSVPDILTHPPPPPSLYELLSFSRFPHL